MPIFIFPPKFPPNIRNSKIVGFIQKLVSLASKYNSKYQQA
jgi:hypothetical protein